MGLEGLMAVSNSNGQSSPHVFRLLNNHQPASGGELDANWRCVAPDSDALNVQVAAGAGTWLKAVSHD